MLEGVSNNTNVNIQNPYWTKKNLNLKNNKF